MALVITIYQVWSRVLAPRNCRTSRLHATVSQWNAPGTNQGAVQWRDKISEDFYRQNEAARKKNPKLRRNHKRQLPVLNVDVYIKEISIEIDEQHLSIT